jgi:hypothetical protein
MALRNSGLINGVGPNQCRRTGAPLRVWSRAACDFDLIAFECDPRMILDIQEISAPEARVTLRLPRPDRRGIDCHVS